MAGCCRADGRARAGRRGGLHRRIGTSPSRRITGLRHRRTPSANLAGGPGTGLPRLGQSAPCDRHCRPDCARERAGDRRAIATVAVIGSSVMPRRPADYAVSRMSELRKSSSAARHFSQVLKLPWDKSGTNRRSITVLVGTHWARAIAPGAQPLHGERRTPRRSNCITSRPLSASSLVTTRTPDKSRIHAQSRSTSHVSSLTGSTSRESTIQSGEGHVGSPFETDGDVLSSPWVDPECRRLGSTRPRTRAPGSPEYRLVGVTFVHNSGAIRAGRAPVDASRPK
jgi:hypothetical protein